MRAGHPNYVRSVMTASQIPFSCYPRCATLFCETTGYLFRMNNVGADQDFLSLRLYKDGVLDYAIDDHRAS